MNSRRRLNILLSAYACEPNRGSEPGVGWNWACCLAARQHTVCVVTRTNNSEAIARGLETLPAEIRKNLTFVYFDLPPWARRLKRLPFGIYPYYAFWQRGIVKLADELHTRNQFDLVHHLTFGVWRGATFLHRLKLPLIVGPVGGGEVAPTQLLGSLPNREYIRERLRGALNWLGGLRPSPYLEHADVVLCKTHETARVVETMTRLVRVQMEIGVSNANVERSAVVRDGPFRVLFAGRLLGWKGCHLAVMAFASASRRVNLEMTIVGDGPMRADLHKLAEDLHVADRVRFTGWVPQQNLFDLYRNSDVFVFPSMHDSSGNVVLEAMSFGLPVISLKTGGPAVLLENGGGVTVTTDASFDQTVEAIASAIVRFATDTDWYSFCSDTALKAARERTWMAAVSEAYTPYEG